MRSKELLESHYNQHPLRPFQQTTKQEVQRFIDVSHPKSVAMFVLLEIESNMFSACVGLPRDWCWSEDGAQVEEFREAFDMFDTQGNGVCRLRRYWASSEQKMNPGLGVVLHLGGV